MSPLQWHYKMGRLVESTICLQKPLKFMDNVDILSLLCPYFSPFFLTVIDWVRSAYNNITGSQRVLTSCLEILWKWLLSLSLFLNQVFVNKCIRNIHWIRWPDTNSNADLWRKTNQQPLKTTIRTHKWNSSGHTLRKQKKLHKFQWNPQGQQKVGRPTNTWCRVLKYDLKKIGKTCSETKLIAKDRDLGRIWIKKILKITKASLLFIFII